MTKVYSGSTQNSWKVSRTFRWFSLQVKHYHYTELHATNIPYISTIHPSPQSATHTLVRLSALDSCPNCTLYPLSKIMPFLRQRWSTLERAIRDALGSNSTIVSPWTNALKIPQLLDNTRKHLNKSFEQICLNRTCIKMLDVFLWWDIFNVTKMKLERIKSQKQ